MPKKIVPLTEIGVKNLKYVDKVFKKFDGEGLFIQITETSKLWRLKYRFNNKEKLISLGPYPIISLKEARELRNKYKSMILNGIDPSEQKKQKKEEIKKIKIDNDNNFYKVSQRWLKNYKPNVTENYHIKLEKQLENYIYPFIKDRLIKDIKRSDIINILEELKAKELLSTADRTHMVLKKIFEYAVNQDFISHNIVFDVNKKTILGKIAKNHYPTFTKEKDIKGLLLSIDSYIGDYSTKMIMKIIPYLFVRSENIRTCEWSELDLVNNVWIIPANKMKVKEEFTLPLPTQVVELFREIEKNKIDEKYVFPSPVKKGSPLSDNTLISALRRMGYSKEQLVIHSFRSIFSTIAYENANTEIGHNFTSEVIEELLAHQERNRVKATYNRAKYNDAKKKLMQWYANFLDALKNKDF